MADSCIFPCQFKIFITLDRSVGQPQPHQNAKYLGFSELQRIAPAAWPIGQWQGYFCSLCLLEVSHWKWPRSSVEYSAEVQPESQTGFCSQDAILIHVAQEQGDSAETPLHAFFFWTNYWNRRNQCACRETGRSDASSVKWKDFMLICAD